MEIRVNSKKYIDVREGGVYNVESEAELFYRIIDDVGDRHSIYKEDCEIVEEWSGEGLPPVGQKCLAVCTDGDYHEVEIVYVNQDQFVAVFEDPTSPGLKYYWQTVDRFKPLKSQEEIEKERVVKEMSDSISLAMDYVDSTEGVANYLYNLGYRKTT